MAYLILVQRQHSYKISKAYRLGFSIFELHILISILCILLLPSFKLYCKVELGRRMDGGEHHDLETSYGCKVDLVKAVKLSYDYAISFLEGRYKIMVNFCVCLQTLQCSV